MVISAEVLIAKGGATAVAFVSLYIANPDLLVRFEQDLPLTDVNWGIVYASSGVGYTDYPLAG